MRILFVLIGVAVMAIMVPVVRADNYLVNGDFDAYGPKGQDDVGIEDWTLSHLPDPDWPPTAKYNGSTNWNSGPKVGNYGSVDWWAGHPGPAGPEYMDATVSQTAAVSAGPVTLTGWMVAGSNITPTDFDHYVRIVDGSGVIDSMVMSGQDGGTPWTEIMLTGVTDGSGVTVEWGLCGQITVPDPVQSIVSTHVDELVLTPEPGTLLSLLALGGLGLVRRRR